MASPRVQPATGNGARHPDEPFPFPDTVHGVSLTSTRDHINRVAERVAVTRAKADELAAHLVEAEEAYLHRLAAAFTAGELTLTDLSHHFNAWRARAEVGKRARWTAAFPRLAYDRMVRHEDCRDRWEGVYPYSGEKRPIGGVPVVYVLYDDAGVACYIGSTKAFSDRMRAHRSSGKTWARWEAFRCRDRAHAYERERDLLHQHKPYLNKAVPR